MSSTTSTAGPQLSLNVLDSDQQLSFVPRRLVVAGYTGRDEVSVRAHIDELAAIGIDPPPQVPMLYELDPGLLSTDATAQVDGPGTSGEVEPVLVRHAGLWYLGVGSDHTDRDLERSDVPRSKAVCPKPLGDTVVPLPAGAANGGADAEWDLVLASCEVDGTAYQSGKLSGLRPPSDLIPRALDAGDEGEDLAIFCGTFPLIGGEFRPGTEWKLQLSFPSGAKLTHSYTTNRRTS